MIQVCCARVDERPYAGPHMHAVDGDAHPVEIAPCGVLVAFPVEHEDRPADVGSYGVDEVIGFRGGVAAAGVVVEAETLAPLLRAARLTGHVSVGEAGALCGLDDGEVVVGGADDGRRLPAAYVDAAYVGHRAGRNGEHGEQQRHDRE